MNEARAALLGELLREMCEQDGDRIPDGAWLEVQKAFALPYVETVVLKETAGGAEVWLSRRGTEDPHWPGRPWHIPGGLWRTSRNLLEACRDVAAGEMRVDVTAVRELFTFKWPDHPYGHPISHVCLCETVSPPPFAADAGFFPLDAPPEPLLARHRQFLDQLRQMRDQLR